MNYRRVEMDAEGSTEPVNYVGVHPLQWGKTDRPECGFVEEESQRIKFGTWIPVAERLPDKDALYIVCAPSADPDRPMLSIAWYDPRGFGWSLLAGVWIEALTHWMPMPEPPSVVYTKDGQ